MKNEHRGIEFFIIEHKDTMKQSSFLADECQFSACLYYQLEIFC